MNREFAKKKIKDLRDEINHHNILYYDEHESRISDYEYDNLLNKLIELENEYPEFKSDDSPSQKVGGTITKNFETVKHSTPMLSLSNTYSDEELNDFDKRVKKNLNKDKVEYLCELKYDGVALSIRYENSKFKMSITRGDGYYGDNISNNVKTIKTIPLTLNKKNQDLEVRGEAFISKKNFEILNNKKKLKDESLFSNPRNTASGSLKMQDSKEVAKRRINCYIYSLITEKENIKTQEEGLIFLKSIGFNVPETYKKCMDIEEVKNYIKKWDLKRHKLDVETDGIVIKVNDLYSQQKLGNTSKSPRWAIAFKYKAESKKTKVKNIIFQVGRTGAITPVAILSPVQIGGSIVKRASLHNANEIERLDVRINDTVFIEKGGEIIPKITRVDLNEREPLSKEFTYIDTCPSCGSNLTILDGEANHYCTNKLKCKPQISGRIEHFISKNAMDIEFLGPETIKGLIEKNIILNLSDLYKIKYDDIIGLEFQTSDDEKYRSLKEKSCNNIIESIKKSKEKPFSSILFGLGIRYIGKTTAEKISDHFKSIDKLINATYDEIISVDEVGDKIAESILEYFSDRKNIDIVENLKGFGLNLKVDDKRKELKSNKLNGLTFVVSGKFLNFSRDGIEKEIESNGGKVVKSISKKTNYLIAGEKMGPKKKLKAEELGIQLISENNFISLL